MTFAAGSATRHNFAGDGSATSFSYNVKIPTKTDITVVHTNTSGAEDALGVLAVDTDYTVNGAGDQGGGSVDFPIGGSAYSTLASGEKLSIIYNFPIAQTLDLPDVGRVFNKSVEDQFDYSTALHNQAAEKLDRAALLVSGSTLTGLVLPEGTSAANRKNKLITWNDDGDDFALGTSVGTYKGDWATATAYNARDTVKDTSNDNIYWCNTTHTSVGAQPISGNADVAKWDLLVDAAASAASAAAAAASAADAAADAVSTAADVVLTGLDVVSTNADVVTTNADVVLTGLDVVSTNADVVSTNADVVLTGLDVASTNADVVTTNADVVSTNADVVTTTAQVGAVAFKYTFSDTTTMADPGAGMVRFNHATLASVTAIAFDATSADTGNPDISDYLMTLDDSTATPRGHIMVKKSGAPATFVVFNITGASVDNTGWVQMTVTHNDSNSTLTDADTLYISAVRSGDDGLLTSLVGDLTPQMGGPLDTNSFAINESEGAAVASATTPDIFGGNDGNTLHITGTTQIDDFADTSSVGQWRKVIFDGVLTLTHGSGITLPGSASITTAAGDYAFVYADAVDAFTVLYFKADGTAVVGTTAEEYIKLHDAKATTTQGGTFTSGAWQKRTVTEDQDDGGNVTVTSSVIVLAAGTYDCLIKLPAYKCGVHQGRLYNTTGTVTLIVGTNGESDAADNTVTDAFIMGRFTIAASQNIEIQHRCAVTRATNGFGSANSFGENEIYVVAEFWKVA